MSNIGDFWFHYNNLDYQFPMAELPPQPVVRIPVAGPEPFNTLVVVRCQFPIGRYHWADGKLHDEHTEFAGTHFFLRGNSDEDDAPTAEHSTTAVLNHIQQSSGYDLWLGDSPFVHAFDAISDAAFVFDGAKWRWCISFDHAWLAHQVYSAATIHVSSWVLCTEPRSKRPGGSIGAQIWRPYDPLTTPYDRPAAATVLGAPGAQPRVKRRSQVE